MTKDMAFWSRWFSSKHSPKAVPSPVPSVPRRTVEDPPELKEAKGIDFSCSEYEEVIDALKSLDLRNCSKADRYVASRLIRAARNDGVGLPALPQSVARLRQTLDDPKSDAASVARALKSEPTIAARIVGVANSPIYGSCPAAGVEGAVMRLGFVRTRSLVTAVVARSRLFRVQSQAELAQRIYEDAIGTAAVAEMLSRNAKGLLAEDAFAAGLFHDLGRLFVLSIADEVHSQGTRSPTPKFIHHACEGTDGPFSALLVRSWGYDERLVQAMRGHNKVKLEDEIVFLEPDDPNRLTHILAASETIVQLLREQATPYPNADRLKQLPVLADQLLAALDVEFTEKLMEEAKAGIERIQNELSVKPGSRAAA